MASGTAAASRRRLFNPMPAGGRGGGGGVCGGCSAMVASKVSACVGVTLVTALFVVAFGGSAYMSTPTRAPELRTIPSVRSTGAPAAAAVTLTQTRPCAMPPLQRAAVGAVGRCRHRGVLEVELHVTGPASDRSLLEVTFRPPGVGTRHVAAGFYDGQLGDDADGVAVFRARAYCHTVGQWQWAVTATTPGLHVVNDTSGVFESVSCPAHPLPGKLRTHPDDGFQFARDDGSWFLHVGDTGYRYVIDTEPLWREYIDQAVDVGFNKIRTWFAMGRHGVGGLYTGDRSAVNLPVWAEMDRRITYALQQYPHVVLTLILFGEDKDELERYGTGDAAARAMPAYAQARWSAYPNVYWTVVNDVTGKEDAGSRRRADHVRLIAKHMARREAWDTLLTSHEVRGYGYQYLTEPWSDIITLQDKDQLNGDAIRTWRERAAAAHRIQPVVLDEDRYESWLTPANPKSYFRRLFWASTLAGGAATYGGIATYEPKGKAVRATVAGMMGYHDAVAAGYLQDGAGHLRHLATFFDAVANVMPEGMVGFQPATADALLDPVPSDAVVHGVAHHPHRQVWVAYLGFGKAVPSQLTLALPEDGWRARLYCPRTGQWLSQLANASPTVPVPVAHSALRTGMDRDVVVVVFPRA